MVGCRAYKFNGGLVPVVANASEHGGGIVCAIAAHKGHCDVAWVGLQKNKGAQTRRLRTARGTLETLNVAIMQFMLG
jgi:hypothetical protein